MDISNQNGHRWYDQEPLCTRWLKQIQEIPQPEVRQFCGKLLSHLAEQMRKQIQYKNQYGVTSIGLHGIEGLYRFKQEQRRWYDSEMEVQHGVSRLYMLPPEGLVALGFSIGDTFGLISVYAQVCAELGETPQSREMVQISQKALLEGQDIAVDFVKSLIGDDLFDALYSGSFNY